MTTELITPSVIGVDVSKSSVTVHILTQYPKGGLESYWQKTRNKSSLNYPVFFSSPKKRKGSNQIQKTAFDFADYIKEHQPDIAVLEPTGNHYSRLWAKILESLGVKILWVGHIQLRRYRESKHLPNKSDPADALAMAAYPLDQEHQLEEGGINPKRFLMHRPFPIDNIRDLVQQLEHLNRVQSPIINYTRQMLAWQWPEKAHSKTEAKITGNVPPLWGWLADRQSQVNPREYRSLSRQYEKSIALQYGLEIDPITKLHADWLCDIALFEQKLEQQLEALVNHEQFSKYNQVFDLFGFGLRVRARLLSRIYPFESFLLNGKPLTEHEIKEVKKKEVVFENRERVVKFQPGDVKRVTRHRSRDAFKLRLGMGTKLQQSGDKIVEKGDGSAICRMTFWQFVITKIEIDDRLPENHVTEKIITYRNKLKNIKDHNNKQLLSGKHIQGKLMSKVANLLFSELCKVWR
jgi:hypothetical protein